VREQIRCRQCGDLIGVYEPLILLTDGHPRETSRAAHPNTADGAQCFHRQCYEDLSQQDRPQL